VNCRKTKTSSYADLGESGGTPRTYSREEVTLGRLLEEVRMQRLSRAFRALRNCRLIGAAFLVAASGNALSHSTELPVDADPAAAAMQYCHTVAVRAAWGAQARFLGAPATFKYVAEVPLRKMFGGAVEEIPTDGIYVLDELNLEQRQRYEEVAFYGWKQADNWVREGRARPAYVVLAALFYNGCKETMTHSSVQSLSGLPRP
jgi:hypothetical protein